MKNRGKCVTGLARVGSDYRGRLQLDGRRRWVCDPGLAVACRGNLEFHCAAGPKGLSSRPEACTLKFCCAGRRNKRTSAGKPPCKLPRHLKLRVQSAPVVYLRTDIYRQARVSELRPPGRGARRGTQCRSNGSPAREASHSSRGTRGVVRPAPTVCGVFV